MQELAVRGQKIFVGLVVTPQERSIHVVGSNGPQRKVIHLPSNLSQEGLAGVLHEVVNHFHDRQKIRVAVLNSVACADMEFQALVRALAESIKSLRSVFGGFQSRAFHVSRSAPSLSAILHRDTDRMGVLYFNGLGDVYISHVKDSLGPGANLIVIDDGLDGTLEGRQFVNYSPETCSFQSEIASDLFYAKALSPTGFEGSYDFLRVAHSPQPKSASPLQNFFGEAFRACKLVTENDASSGDFRALMNLGFTTEFIKHLRQQKITIPEQVTLHNLYQAIQADDWLRAPVEELSMRDVKDFASLGIYLLQQYIVNVVQRINRLPGQGVRNSHILVNSTGLRTLFNHIPILETVFKQSLVDAGIDKDHVICPKALGERGQVQMSHANYLLRQMGEAFVSS